MSLVHVLELFVLCQVAIVWFGQFCFLCHISSQIIHPIVIKNIFSKFGKSSVAIYQIFNFADRTDVLRISASRTVNGYLPFLLCKELEVLDNRNDFAQVV